MALPTKGAPPNLFARDHLGRILNIPALLVIYVVLLRPRDSLPLRPPDCVYGGGTRRPNKGNIRIVFSPIQNTPDQIYVQVDEGNYSRTGL